MKNYTFNQNPARCAILMSGSGSNTEALLEFERAVKNPCYQTVVLATDAPESSRAREIAAKYALPLVEHDIKKFYSRHGEESIKLDTPRRRELREKWSEEFFAMIAPYTPDFACFAGFVPLSNIAKHLPCLNVHPGDLTCCNAEGVRIYAGLHVLPVERAILNGESALRSSVILVQPYSGNGAKEMDEGPVMGVSAPVKVDLEGLTLEELEKCRTSRTPGVKCSDALRTLALKHIERLKVEGDHVVFPQVVNDFAAGKFSVDGKKLFYEKTEVLSVEYSKECRQRNLIPPNK